MNVDLKGVEIGQELFSSIYGVVTVTLTNSARLTVQGTSEYLIAYRYDGRLRFSSIPSAPYATLFLNKDQYLEYAKWVHKQESLPDLKVDDLLVVWNRKSITRAEFRYFSHWEKDKIKCFCDGKTSFVDADTLLWERFRRPTQAEIKTKQVDQSNRESLV